MYLYLQTGHVGLEKIRCFTLNISGLDQGCHCTFITDLSVFHRKNHPSYSPQPVLVRRAGTQLPCVVQAHEQAGGTGAGEGRHEARGLALDTLTLVIWQQLKIHSFRINHSLE